MNNFTPIFATTILVSQFSLALAADPGTHQLQRTPMPQLRGTAQPVKITPEYLNQQIWELTQQLQALQSQVLTLRSVVHVTQHGATIQAESLTVHAQKILLLKDEQDLRVEGKAPIGLKAPQIQLTTAPNLWRM